MPINPSDLAWWAWLLIAAGAGVVAVIAREVAAYASEKDSTGRSAKIAIPVSITVIGTLIAAVTGIIGIIRFVKWIWAS